MKDPVIIFAIDPALLCGWAVIVAHSDGTTEHLDSGVEDFKPLYKKATHVGEFVRAVGVFVDNAGPNEFADAVDVWAIETPAGMRGMATIRISHTFMLASQESSFFYEAKWLGVAPSTLKKWATGHGHAKKPEMIVEAAKRFPGVEIIDDNHADALLITAWAAEQIYPQAEQAKEATS